MDILSWSPAGGEGAVTIRATAVERVTVFPVPRMSILAYRTATYLYCAGNQPKTQRVTKIDPKPLLEA